ncbi:DUF1275 family protein [Gammaproteobacteria bacterium]|nr:DUF1275 family protein [Gammaproteobacteria bacterium]
MSNYARTIAGRKRSEAADLQLGFTLAFIAGAINAGGFLAVQQYTSHMTGIVSSVADNIVLGNQDLVLSGIGGLISFLLGASSSSIMVNYAKRHKMHSQYALPLLCESLLLLCFGFLGARLANYDALFVPLTVMLLCFIMGLQNAMITKLSHSVIRTTHITGIITDIGIELGKLFYWNASKTINLPKVLANRKHLKVLSLLASLFFLGGVIGACGFKYIGYLSTLPLALTLFAMGILPAIDDLLVFMRLRVRKKRR